MHLKYKPSSICYIANRLEDRRSNRLIASLSQPSAISDYISETAEDLFYNIDLSEGTASVHKYVIVDWVILKVTALLYNLSSMFALVILGYIDSTHKLYLIECF